jgi:peptide/nickel transport system substrate-binding protein
MSRNDDYQPRSLVQSAISARVSRRQAFKLAAAAGAGAAALSAGLERFDASAATDPNTLVVGRNIDDVITLDPSIAGEETYTVVFRAAYNTLITTDPADPGNKIVPELAESWTVAPDASKVTLKLKQGLTFASGNPITSADVKFTLDRLKNINNQDSYLMTGVASVDTPDANTVDITLSAPNSAFLASLTSVSFSIMDAAVVKAHGGVSDPGADKTDKATDWLNQNSAGSGPYIMTGYTPKDRITFKRNDKAAVRKAAIDNFLFQAAPDTSALQQTLSKGDVDLAWGLLTEQLDALAKDPNIETASTPMLGFLALGMTCDPKNNKAVADPKVQQALKLAVDYDGIRSLREGALTPPSLVPIGLQGALDPAKDGIKQDKDKAKQLLSDAGYGSGFDATISASSTEILGGVQDSDLAEKLQADFGDIGVNLTLDVQDETIFRPKYRAGDIQLVIGGWYVSYPTAFDILDNWGPAGPVSKTRLRWNAPNHPAIALIEQARKEVDDAKRADLLQQAQRALMADAPYTTLIQPVFSYPYRKGLKGVVANPFYNFDPSTISRS